MNPELIAISRLLARVLRHKPELWGIKLDANGWCDVDALLAGAMRNGCNMTLEQLLTIVDTNDKARFTLSPDGLRIRAAQGHSVSIDLNLPTSAPPPVLYHSTGKQLRPLAQGAARQLFSLSTATR